MHLRVCCLSHVCCGACWRFSGVRNAMRVLLKVRSGLTTKSHETLDHLVSEEQELTFWSKQSGRDHKMWHGKKILSSSVVHLKIGKWLLDDWRIRNGFKSVSTEVKPSDFQQLSVHRELLRSVLSKSYRGLTDERHGPRTCGRYFEIDGQFCWMWCCRHEASCSISDDFLFVFGSLPLTGCSSRNHQLIFRRWHKLQKINK